MPLGMREIYIILRARDEASRTLRAAGGAMRGFGAASLTTQQRLMGVATATTAVGAAFTAAGAAGVRFYGTVISEAVEYNKQAAQTLTQTDNVKTSVQELADVGRRVGRQIGAPFEELQGVLYNIFSSIDVNVPEAEALLRGFAREAVAGGAEIQSSARSTIAIMNAWQLGVEDLARIQDMQFQTVRKGVITYEELSSVIGRAIPAAARAGQEVETLGAMIAFLTRNGLSAQMASTSAARAMELFAHPKTIARMEELGIKVRDATGEFAPLNDVIQQLGRHVQGMPGPERSEFLQDLFKGAGNRIQARRFWDMALKNFEEFDKHIQWQINNAGAFADAYAIMAEEPATQLQILKNRWQALRTELGEALLPALEGLIAVGAAVLGWLESLDKGTIETAVRIGAIVSAFMLVMGVSMMLIGALAGVIAVLMMANLSFLAAAGIVLGIPALIAAVIAGLIALVVYWEDVNNTIQRFIEWSRPAWEPIAAGVALVAAGLAWMSGLFSDLWVAAQPVMDTLTSSFTGLLTVARVLFALVMAHPFVAVGAAIVAVAILIIQNWETVRDTVISVWDLIYSHVSSVLSSIWSAVEPVVTAIGTAFSTVWAPISAGIDFIIAAFELFRSVVSTVASAIGAYIQAVWNNVWAPVFNFLVAVIKDAVIPAFQLWWEVVTTVFGAIVTIIQTAWGIISKIFEIIERVIVGVLILAFRALREAVKIAWQRIQDDISFAWNNIIKPIWNAIKWTIDNVIAPAMRWLAENVFGPSWERIQGDIDFAWNSVIKPIWNAIKWAMENVIAPVVRWLADNVFGPAWDRIQADISFAWNNVIKPVWNGIKSFLENVLVPALRSFRDFWSRLWEGMADKVSGVWNSIASGIRSAVNGVLGLVEGFLQKMVDGINWIIEQVNKLPGDDIDTLGRVRLGRVKGQPVSHAGARGIGGGARAHTGGVIGEDVARNGAAIGHLREHGLGPNEVNITALRNEGILNPQAMQALGKGTFRRLNNAASMEEARAIMADVAGMGQRGYRVGRGAPLPASLKGQTTIPQLSQVGRSAGGIVTSAYRSGSTTFHGRGQAVDFGGNMRAVFNRFLQMAGNMNELFWTPAGFSIKNGRRVPPIAARTHFDHVHAAATPEMLSGAGLGGGALGDLFMLGLDEIKGWVTDRALSPVKQMLAATVPEGMGGIVSGFGNVLTSRLGELPGDLYEWAKNAVFGFLPGVGGGGNDSANRSLGQELATAFGWAGEQWNALQQLWTRESNWSHTAKNPSSGAFGIPQALPGNKMAAAGSDWMTNPATQIRWGLGYIRDRYGTPSAALAHHDRKNWYGKGGMINETIVGIGMRTGEHHIFGEAGPEAIVPMGGATPHQYGTTSLRSLSQMIRDSMKEVLPTRGEPGLGALAGDQLGDLRSAIQAQQAAVEASQELYSARKEINALYNQMAQLNGSILRAGNRFQELQEMGRVVSNESQLNWMKAERRVEDIRAELEQMKNPVRTVAQELELLRARKAVRDYREELQTMRAAVRAGVIVSPEDELATIRQQERVEELAQTLREMKNPQIDTAAVERASEGLEKAAAAFKSAQTAVAQGRAGVGQATAELRRVEQIIPHLDNEVAALLMRYEAEAKLADAQHALAEAEEDAISKRQTLTDAERTLKEARDVGAVSVRDIRAAELELQIARNKLTETNEAAKITNWDLREAELLLAQAQENLNEKMAFGSLRSGDLRMKQLELKIAEEEALQARRNLADFTPEYYELEAKLEELRERRTATENDFNAAVQAVTTAQFNNMDAILGLKEATQSLNGLQPKSVAYFRSIANAAGFAKREVDALLGPVLELNRVNLWRSRAIMANIGGPGRDELIARTGNVADIRQRIMRIFRNRNVPYSFGLVGGETAEQRFQRLVQEVMQGRSFESIRKSVGHLAAGMQHGGVALSRIGGTLARIGEGGRDEAVIPLPRNWRQQDGLGKTEYNIHEGAFQFNFNGPVTEDVMPELEEKIDESLDKFLKELRGDWRSR